MPTGTPHQLPPQTSQPPSAFSAGPVSASLPCMFEPGALRANRLFESNDLDDTRERISRVMQPHELVPLAGRVRGARSHMDFLRIGGIGLGTIKFGEAMRVDVGEVEDYHLLMFCLSGHADARANGRAVLANTSQGMVCAPGHAFVADLSTDCEQFVVRLDRAMVESHCGRALRFDESLDLRRPGLAAWVDQLRVLATSQTLVGAAQRNPMIATELERLFVHLLVDGQPWVEQPAPGASRRSAAAGCVHRAEQFIETRAADPIRLADIANAAGVPARTLLDGFKRFRESSPMQHLRDVRLGLARAQLLAADDGARVSDIAQACGFVHMGRFAEAYQQRFGEAPSATLAARR